jgi:hypothetical protein
MGKTAVHMNQRLQLSPADPNRQQRPEAAPLQQKHGASVE